jgi:hypothetical protein
MALIGLMTDLKKLALEAYMRSARELEAITAHRARPSHRGARGLWGRPSRYDGDKLRELRAERGVGRRMNDYWRLKCYQRGEKDYPALVASFWGRPSPNLAEWERKPRRAAR